MLVQKLTFGELSLNKKVYKNNENRKSKDGYYRVCFPLS